MSIKKVKFILPTIVMLVLAIFSVHALHTQALTGSDFQAGRIIDDAVFTDTASMSITDINNWLAAKMPSCDTNGSKSYSYYYNSSTGEINNSSAGSWVTTSRATYGQRWDTWRSKQTGATVTTAAAPYVCLKDYREDPNTHQNNLQNPGASIPGAVTAGEIIYYASSAYHINPQVILTTLQKEQGLISDDWPWTSEYKAAMGYACPDDGTGCHSAYAGFAVQVNSAAAQFRNYLTNPGNYNFIAGQNNYIGYYPCNSGTTVFIQNQSTAALYDYTPYQPDAGVLNNTNPTGSSNGPGSVPYADSCATYGNRNFWWYFNSWFGSSFAINGSIQLVSGLSLTPSATNLYVNDSVTASYQVKNTASYDINAGSLGVCATINGQWYDFGFANDVVVPANSTITISYSRKLTTPGNLQVHICSYNPAFGWANTYYPYDINGGLSRQTSLTITDNPLLTSGIELGPTNPGIEEPVNAYVTIKNSSGSSINIGSLVVAVRNSSGANLDFPIKNDVVIPANSSQQLVWTQTFTTPGNYSFSLANWNGSWTTTYPHSSANTIVRQLNWPILDNPLIASGISISTNPSAGQPTTATISIRNTSGTNINIGSLVIAARDATGNNVDFPITNDVVIPAETTKSFSWTKTFPAGSYTLFIAHWKGTWDTSYPKSMDSSVIRTMNLKIN